MRSSAIEFLRSHDRGAAIVEFAFVAPIAVLLVFAILDFGVSVYNYHLVANAARIGTRYAIVRGSNCTVTGCPATKTQISDYVESHSPGLDPTLASVDTSWAAGSGCTASPYQGPGCVVTVTVSYPFGLTAPMLPRLSWSMSSTSKMVIAQ